MFDTPTDVHEYYDREFDLLDSDLRDGGITKEEHEVYTANLNKQYAQDLDRLNGPYDEPF